MFHFIVTSQKVFMKYYSKQHEISRRDKILLLTSIQYIESEEKKKYQENKFLVGKKEILCNEYRNACLFMTVLQN